MYILVIIFRSDYGFAELKWENGQLCMARTSSSDTLECIVHQATCHKHGHDYQDMPQTPANINSLTESSNGFDRRVKIAPLLMKKNVRPDMNPCAKRIGFRCNQNENLNRSVGASVSAPDIFSGDKKTIPKTAKSWASFQSPRILKNKSTEEDSSCHGGSENQDEDGETKTETVRSNSSRRVRAAAIHNQSERRRRNRINQKMKALQKLVPNASKTDKASMLDEVIEYLKQLQTQVQVMNVRNMPQMLIPLGMQQHLHQLSALERMGMGAGPGMGLGMLDMSTMGSIPQTLPPFIHPKPPPSVAAATPAFIHPGSFVVHHPLFPIQGPGTVAERANADLDSKSSAPPTDPYSAFVAQSMNTEMYNKMVSLYLQQVSQSWITQLNATNHSLVQGERENTEESREETFKEQNIGIDV
ncbi:hypothetical protein K2173_028176 [Erythroxylum novogranatense]|uniref:BHLH domain-containing protein n=1 Tax=Erythroxylum novogranatense TaxID=1862640 RepID=A0AAV8U438_9ROSI|nr:hypothetical protein K2173_028176 [Erythroxylum novogranatense]